MKSTSILKINFFLLLLSVGLLGTLSASAQEQAVNEAVIPAEDEAGEMADPMPEAVTDEEDADTATLTEMPGTESATTEGAGKPAMDEEMMAKWKEASTPNENHKILNKLVGEWDHTLQWWMEPGSTPEESAGTSKVDWIMDGRFVEHNVHGTSMGQPFNGIGIVGYDNVKKQYDSIWIDNMGTGMMHSNGQYDAATDTLSESGSFSCPIKGDTAYKAKYTFVDQDHYTYEMYMNDMKTGEEFRSMLISYTRQK